MTRTWRSLLDEWVQDTANAHCGIDSGGYPHPAIDSLYEQLVRSGRHVVVTEPDRLDGAS